MINVSFSAPTTPELFQQIAQFAQTYSMLSTPVQDPRQMTLPLDTANAPSGATVSDIKEKKPRAAKTKKEAAEINKDFGGPVAVEPEMTEASDGIPPKTETATASGKTQDDCRDAISNLNSVKGIQAARAILKQFNVERISGLAEDKYAEFVAACDLAQLS